MSIPEDHRCRCNAEINKEQEKNELAIETDRPRPGLGAQHESATRKGTPLKHSKFYYFGRNWIKQKVAPG